MRFDVVSDIKIDDLCLDEGNYRFQRAEDQKDCIEKIHAGNKPYFVNLMTSIAEDDLGEPLLVYRDDDDNKNIVMDGNRRLAALKVLYDLDMAPSASVRKRAEALMKSCRFDFKNIHAQVSRDKDLILKTVYERHASGQGRSRLPWNALANAKFRFQEKQFDGHDWHEIALLIELEIRDPAAVTYVYEGKYSHEVFRRIVRAAVSAGLIPPTLFSERDQRIKKSKKKELDRALGLVKEFLAHMEGGGLNLSRKGDSYADKRKINEYLARFAANEHAPAEDVGSGSGAGGESELLPKSPSDDPSDRLASENEQAQSKRGGTEALSADKDTRGDTADDLAVAPNDDTSGAGAKKSPALDRSVPKKIPTSETVVRLLNEYGSLKLTNLYSSLTGLPLKQHPAICMIGAWAFFEALARDHGAKDGNAFDAYFNSKIAIWFTKGSGTSKSMRRSLEYILHEGNCNKHCATYVSLDATPLINHFDVLDPLLVKVLEELVEKEGSRKIL